MDLLRILDGTPEPPVIDLHLETVNVSGVYNLGTPMYEFQKELTDQIVSLHYPDILKYCEANDNTCLIVKSLEICIANCMLVSTHPYLLIKHYMPKNFAQKDISRKLSETSGKFNVLKDLLNVIIATNPSLAKNICLVSKNDSRFFDLVEALVIGCDGNKSVKRYCGNNVQRESKLKTLRKEASTPPVNIHLVPGDGSVQKLQQELLQVPFDVVILIDGHVDADSPFVKTLRHQNRSDDCVCLRLVPIKTIEHCSLVTSTSEKGHLYKLVSSIVCLREFNGNLLPDLFPIYNQKLTYLSDKFFKSVFASIPGKGFVGWPLPDLPSIPAFAALDVEKSLLTEVHFHYTPYDTVEQNSESEPPYQPKRKRTYYETKRLELDYLTNPLKNNISKLIGINSHGRSEVCPARKDQVLTHNQIMELNTAHMYLVNLERERDCYRRQNSSTVQARVGRRLHDTKLTLASILGDLSHSEMRIASAEKLELKKRDAISRLKQDSLETLEKVASYQQHHEISDSKLIAFLETQNEIWKLQDKIKASAARIESRTNENAYMLIEYEKCVASLAESDQGILKMQETLKELSTSLEHTTTAAEDRAEVFVREKANLELLLQEAKQAGHKQEQKLGLLMAFLRDTWHLKKRKGRVSGTK